MKKKKSVSNALKLSHHEILVFLHNAELGAAQEVEESQERERVVKIWKGAFHERIKKWLDEGLLTRGEVIFILASVAKEIWVDTTKNNRTA